MGFAVVDAFPRKFPMSSKIRLLGIITAILNEPKTMGASVL
jgi:hypothetical protein